MFFRPPKRTLIGILFLDRLRMGGYFFNVFRLHAPNGFNNGLIFEIVFKSAYLRYAAHSWPIGMRFVLVNS